MVITGMLLFNGIKTLVEGGSSIDGMISEHQQAESISNINSTLGEQSGLISDISSTLGEQSISKR